MVLTYSLVFMMPFSQYFYSPEDIVPVVKRLMHLPVPGCFKQVIARHAINHMHLFRPKY